MSAKFATNLARCPETSYATRRRRSTRGARRKSETATVSGQVTGGVDGHDSFVEEKVTGEITGVEIGNVLGESVTLGNQGQQMPLKQIGIKRAAPSSGNGGKRQATLGGF